MRLQIKAFTLVETLLTLMIVSFIYMGLTGSVKTSFQQVEEKVFFAEFEHLYQESQKIALAKQTELDLEVSASEIRTPYQTVSIPASVSVQDPKTIQLDRAGGNSSLANLHFTTQRGVVTYQLSLGNGKIKRVSSPASILLESLVALSLFAMITTLLLGEMRRSRTERLADFKEMEVLSVAQMALQTGKNSLTVNGIQVEVEKDAQHITVYHQGKAVLHVE
ncbi:competence type IV pilus minor pilin ComGD [Streptococcus lactarius]|uniref:competence type IV pilus minor pilin ComGD n=2 Tax=Streptococcus TaxID=1301 RepID=UPI00361819CE